MTAIVCTVVLLLVSPSRASQCCPCDWNNNRVLNSQDFFDFIASFFSGDADFNADNTTTSQDFFDFLSCFFTGCPAACCPGHPNPNESGEQEPAQPQPSGCRGSGSPPQAMEHMYPFSGEAVETGVDMRIAGRGMDFIWARKYRSGCAVNSALGNGWDFSYNISIRPVGADLEVSNGWNRRDVYVSQPDGTWTRSEFFRVISQLPDGRLAMIFPDTGQWLFRPLGIPLVGGKIDSIADRNGNTIVFSYDALGRLNGITDSLGRQINVAYNANGLIASVTDFTGRQVVYTYYNAGDAGGSAGDLSSVRSPIVAGTPNGNNFPAGKTTVYTYSTGSPAAALNHNLLTITDPRLNTYLVNTYAGTTDPANLMFDRVIRQQVGDPGQNIDFTYTPLVPSNANSHAILQAHVIDRLGHPKDFFYDTRNRLVTVQEGTIGLRPGEPPAYTSHWTYNSDSLVTSVLRPRGNAESFMYDSTNPAPTARGNLLTHLLLPGGIPSDQPFLAESFTYLGGFGACCGTDFVLTHTDFRMHTTSHVYDANGNRVQTQHRLPGIVENFEYNGFGQMTAHVQPDNANGGGNRRRDEFAYYVAGAQTGYLLSRTTDAGGLSLTTVYEYDARGNVIRTIDPNLNDTLRIVNQLDQTVRVRSRPVPRTAGGTVRYINDTYYDANNNVTRVDTQNVDANGVVVAANPFFTAGTTYDTLNYPTQSTREIDPARNVVEQYAYDANRNRVLTRRGEAVNGNQAANTISTTYDERDLPFTTTRAAVDPGHSTSQFDYDANGRLVLTRQGTEDVISPRSTLSSYDGFDRVGSTTDAMGNVTASTYDENSNVLTSTTTGELVDATPAPGNIRLTQAFYTYDDMDRRIGTEVAHFNTAATPPFAQTPVGDGFSSSTTVYTNTSQIASMTDDRGNQTTYAYDTANRRLSTVDAKGNNVTIGYDANSNVIGMVETELSDLSPPQVFTTSYSYDTLDRRVATGDNGGNTTSAAYDSRDNNTVAIDARGNSTTYSYDGLNRLIQTTRFLTADGTAPTPGNPVIGTINTSQTWDDDSRLIAQADNNLNATRYAYDALDRRIVTMMTDGTMSQVGQGAVWPVNTPRPILTTFSSGYDVHDNAILTRDANATIVHTAYDLLNRSTSSVVTRGPGIFGTTSESFQYDGLSRRILAQDNASRVTSAYDSLSNLTAETSNLNPPTFPAGSDRRTTLTYDGMGNRLCCTYPGGRIVVTTYDALNRQSEIHAGPCPVPPVPPTGALIAGYSYIGPWRVERKVMGNGTHCDYEYDTSRRITRTTSRDITTFAIIDDRTNQWDPSYNKTERRDEQTGISRQYTYDSVDRMIRGQATTAPSRDTNYVLDGVGNRCATPPAPPDPMNPPPCDYNTNNLNEYTQTGAYSRTYDANGSFSTITGPGITLYAVTYDYRGLMQGITGLPGGNNASYVYDVLGRRVRRTVGATTTEYVYDGWQEIEERPGGAGGGPPITYVWGNYIDEAITMNRPSGPGMGVYYFHSDDMYNVTALTRGLDGTVVDRYEYSDYGTPVDPLSDSPVATPSTVGNTYLFQGRRRDPEVGFYYYRTRYMEPNIGRFETRDTIGTWGDAAEMGNAYSFAASNPWSAMDPMGTATTDDGTTAMLFAWWDFTTRLAILKRGWDYSNHIWTIRKLAPFAGVMEDKIANGIKRTVEDQLNDVAMPMMRKILLDNAVKGPLKTAFNDLTGNLLSPAHACYALAAWELSKGRTGSHTLTRPPVEWLGEKTPREFAKCSWDSKGNVAFKVLGLGHLIGRDKWVEDWEVTESVNAQAAGKAVNAAERAERLRYWAAKAKPTHAQIQEHQRNLGLAREAHRKKMALPPDPPPDWNLP